MSALLLTLLAAGPFPLPSIDGKALAVTDKQTTFRLPMRFEKARAFVPARRGPAPKVRPGTGWPR